MTRLRLSAYIPILTLALLVFFGGGQSCVPPSPAAPAAGLKDHQMPGVVSLPGGLVNTIGGNFLVARTDLSIDTRLGGRGIGATYNSASGAWLWSFDISYDGTIFIDGTAAVHNVSAVADGEAIPGSTWVKLDATRIQSKGGLVYQFDGAGQLQWVKWANLDYPRLSTVTQQIAGATRITAIDQYTAPTTSTSVYSIQYDAQGRVEEIGDRAGRQALFTYDAQGMLATARDGFDVAEGLPGFRYEYTGTDLTAITNSENERIEIVYDGASRATSVRPIGEENPVHSFGYATNQTTYTDPLGYQLRFRYVSGRRPTEIHQVNLGETTTWVYDGAALRPSSVTLPSGEATSWTYDGDDVATKTLPSGNVVSYTYAVGAVDRSRPSERPILEISDSLGVVEQRSYDSPKGRLASITNGAGEVTQLTYDTEEMLASVTTPNGVVVEYADYGEHGHPTELTYAGMTSTQSYDDVGNLIAGTRPRLDSGPGLGGVVSRSFDADRNVETVLLDEMAPSASGPQTLSIEHRSDGRRVQILRPYGGDTEFVYDGLGRMVERREKAGGTGHALWQSTFFEYDALGRETEVTRPNGMRKVQGYDPSGRVSSVEIRRGAVIESSATLTYVDARLASISDSAYGGGQETYGYDSAGRVNEIVYHGGETIYYAYDLRSRQAASILWEAGAASSLRVLSFGYDGADRETWIRDQGNLVIDRQIADGRIERVVYGNGLERSYGYDPVHGLISSTTTELGANTVESTTLDWTLDSGFFDAYVAADTRTRGTVSKRSIEQYVLLGQAVVGGDPEDRTGPRLFQWVDSASNGVNSAYDALSNLTGYNWSFANPQCGQYYWYRYLSFNYNDEHNRLLSMETSPTCAAPLVAYEYDEAGFTTSRGGVALDWDGGGRIQGIGAEAAFSWDSLGRMVSLWTSVTGTQQRLFGGLVEADASGNPTALDLGDVRINLATGGHLYRHYDFRGNVKFTTDDQGDVVAHFKYSPYGVFAEYGTIGTPEETENFAQGRRYAGLLLLGSRLYDADAARFLSPDPFYQLINQYAYALGNPVYFWDPGGMELIAGIGHMLHGAAMIGHGVGILTVGGVTLAAFSPLIGGLEALSAGLSGEYQNIGGTIASGFWEAGAGSISRGASEVAEGAGQVAQAGANVEGAGPADPAGKASVVAAWGPICCDAKALARWIGGPRGNPGSGGPGSGGLGGSGGGVPGGGGGHCGLGIEVLALMPLLIWLSRRRRL